MFTVVLVEPQIPQNTGNIARLCAATNMALLVVGRPGFSMSSRHLKRAGLDYWEHVRFTRQPNPQQFYDGLDVSRAYFLTTKANRPYTDIIPQPHDMFLFGKETAGLPTWLLQQYPERCLTIPMPSSHVRSLNLATSVGIVMYHMLAQYNFGFTPPTSTHP